ncbi:protein-export chaperone SecB [Clostridium sp. FS41]|uniref:protein-export chaperone SecB n=1 Tax=Clostridium sp. FS41 TaxID=1609975 RepID=UPI0005D3696F|nr:protein-export chaperone SecB [Clostridium sp. FS41]KJJ65426.1 protein-export protein SecB [Clostridium sp. FS41]
MANIEPGIIRFEKYEVEEIQFKLNSAYEEEEVNIDIKMEVEATSDDSNEHMRIRLIVHIFDEAIKNKYPFEMKVIVVGYFSIGVEKNNNIDHYQANAVAILYPYIRAIVSTYTASANVTPLILPTVNVNKFLKSNR